MRLSPCRESHVPFVVDVIGCCRSPFCALEVVRDHPVSWCVSATHSVLAAVGETSDVRRCIRPESFTDWTLGLKQCSFDLGNRV
jgi:hypothetical protein